MTSKRPASSWVETLPNDGSRDGSNDAAESSKTKRVRGSNVTKADKTLFMSLLKYHDPNGILRLYPDLLALSIF
jgi:hypothetical protein